MTDTTEMPARVDVPEPPPTRELYVEHADGALSQITTDSEGAPLLPDGARLITAAQYGSRLGKLTAQRDAERGRALEAERAQQRTDYESLTTLGVPAALAARLTGHDAS